MQHKNYKYLFLSTKEFKPFLSAKNKQKQNNQPTITNLKNFN